MGEDTPNDGNFLSLIRGNNVWPVTVDTVVFWHPEVPECAGLAYVDDAGRTQVLVRLAFKPDIVAAPPEMSAALLRKISEAIKHKTNVAMTMTEVPRSDLPTFDYKARRWKDERQQGYDEAAVKVQVWEPPRDKTMRSQQKTGPESLRGMRGRAQVPAISHHCGRT